MLKILIEEIHSMLSTFVCLFVFCFTYQVKKHRKFKDIFKRLKNIRS